MATQMALFFDIRPLRATPLLMAADTLTELVVPGVCRSHIDGARTEAQRHALGLATLA